MVDEKLLDKISRYVCLNSPTTNNYVFILKDIWELETFKLFTILGKDS